MGLRVTPAASILAMALIIILTFSLNIFLESTQESIMIGYSIPDRNVLEGIKIVDVVIDRRDRVCAVVKNVGSEPFSVDSFNLFDAILVFTARNPAQFRGEKVALWFPYSSRPTSGSWAIREVLTGNVGGELINPIDPEASVGMLDPNEAMIVDIRLPIQPVRWEIDVRNPVYLIFSTPSAVVSGKVGTRAPCPSVD